MERLEPILKQKFWILLGVGIMMTFAGWWVATQAMAASIAARKTAIEAAEKKVPSGEIPNESWATKLSAINAVQDKSIQVTQAGLWKRQLGKMTWPQGVEPQGGFWGKFSNQSRELFRDSYPDEVSQVWKMLNPMDADGTGIVNFPLASMWKVLNKGPWPIAPPEPEVMWEVREDLWLLEGLFQSIAALNGGHDANRTDAVLHQIDKLELRGGGDKLQTSSPGGGGAGGDGGGFGGMMGAPPAMSSTSGGGGGAGAMGGGGMSGAATAVSAEFDCREEFGDDGSGAAGSGGGGGGGGGTAGSFGAMGGMGGMGGGGSEGAPSARTVKRYVSDDPALPYKTRGFYLSVRMDHRRIPQLIAELTANEKSVWPVEVIRVQMSRLNEDDSGGGGSGSNMIGGGGSMSAGIPGAFGSGSMGAAMGGGRSDEDAFSAFSTSKPGKPLNAINSSQALAAKMAFENAMRDPSMAQVTICGVFTLYREVKAPVEEKPATVSPAATDAPPLTSDEAAVMESTGVTEEATDDAGVASEEPAPKATEQPAVAPMDSSEPAEPGDDPGEKPAAKAESGEK